MWREFGTALGLCDRTAVERLAATLLRVGADQEVRVLEALAATLVNGCGHDRPGGDLGLAEAEPAAFVDHAPVVVCDRQLTLVRRIARRALRGSLLDPTHGAIAFHRVDANPAWARDLLPVAVIGSFLFYKTSAQEPGNGS